MNCRTGTFTLTPSQPARSDPLGRLPARGVEHPGPERHDEPGFLAQSEELLGQQQTALGMTPAHERLGTHHRPAVQIDHRLVVQLELVALHGPLQVGLERQPAADLTGKHRLVLGDAAAVLRLVTLRVVHRHVRLREHLLRGNPLPRGDRDPDTGMREDLPATQIHRLPNLVEQPGRDVVRLGPVVEIFKQDDELVAAHPRGGVSRTKLRRDPARDRAQQFVTGGMAETVIDRLEVVQVDEQDGDHAFAWHSCVVAGDG